MEEWRDIEGYDGLYQVSNEGRVKSLERYVAHCFGSRRVRERILRQAPRTDGYLEVSLYIDGYSKSYPIHRMVANAFVPNPNNYDVVHHKDHNYLNNFAENLDWISSEEHDKMHGYERGERYCKKVYQYTLDGVLVKVWNSTRECGRAGFDQRSVSHCCNGWRMRNGKWVNITQYKGYRWSYEPL